MTRRFALVAFGLSAIGLSAQGIVTPARPPTGPGTAAADARPGTALITGRVLSGDSESPIAAATVTLAITAQPRAETSSVLTDSQGRFFFSGVAVGAFTVTATKPGWLAGASGRGRPGGLSVPVALVAGQRQADVDIHVWRAAVIAGRVIDASGDPMVAVDVRAFRITYRAGRAQPEFVIRARTDDRGLYRFSALEPADYLICVPATVTSEPSGFAGAVRAMPETPRTYLQTMSEVGAAQMTLERADTVSGNDRWSVSSILGMQGTPPAGGPWLTHPTTCAPAALTRSTATIVRAVSGRERSGVDISIKVMPTYRVSGTLTGPDGPAAYHAVHLIAADSADAPMIDTSTSITDSAGAFTFFGVPPGSYVARVVRIPWPAQGNQLGIAGGTGAIRNVLTFSSGPGMSGAMPAPSNEPLLHATQPVTVGDRDVRDLAMMLQPGVRVSGRLEFEGAAPSPAADVVQRTPIVLEPAMGQLYANILPTSANASGEFTTASTWPGRYVIRVNNPPAGWTLKSAMVQGRDVSETAIDLSTDLSDVVLQFTDARASITGNVQADGAAAKLAPSLVILFPADKSGWTDYGRTSRRVRSTGVSLTGSFTLPIPPDGDYLIVALADADAADWQNPAVLERLVELADRIQVRNAQPLTHALRLRRLR